MHCIRTREFKSRPCLFFEFVDCKNNINKQYTLFWCIVLTKFLFSIALLIPEPVDEKDKKKIEVDIKKKVEIKKVKVKEEPLTGTKGKESTEVADAGK